MRILGDKEIRRVGKERACEDASRRNSKSSGRGERGVKLEQASMRTGEQAKQQKRGALGVELEQANRRACEQAIRQRLRSKVIGR